MKTSEITLALTNIVIDLATNEEIFEGYQMLAVSKEALESNVTNAINDTAYGEAHYTAAYFTSTEDYSYGDTYGTARVIHYLKADKNATIEEKENAAVKILDKFSEVIYASK